MKTALRVLVAGCCLAATFLAQAAAYDDFLNAVKNGNVAETAQWLRRGIDPNTIDPSGMPVLHLAARGGFVDVVKALADARANLNLRNPARESAVMLAALVGHKSVVEFLLSRDAQVNHPGWTALVYAATNGHTAIVAILLDNHAYIDSAPANGMTALMMAARGGHVETVKLLLEEGADPTLKNDLGQSASEVARLAKNTDIAGMIEAKAKVFGR